MTPIQDNIASSSHAPVPSFTKAELAELVGGLAHELRNPLSTLIITLNLLAEDLQDIETRPEETRRRALKKIDVLRREAERLESLLDDFLNLAPFSSSIGPRLTSTR